jgi:hypothetical protein
MRSEQVERFTVVLLRTGLMLSDVAADLTEELPDDSYPGEDTGEVVLEMIRGSAARFDEPQARVDPGRVTTPTLDPDETARSPSRAAVISMMLLVVWARPPLCSSTMPSSQQSSAAHPPGPGLRWHAPSVQMSTSPEAATGRWPGSDLDRRRGVEAMERNSTNSRPGRSLPRTPDARADRERSSSQGIRRTPLLSQPLSTLSISSR